MFPKLYNANETNFIHNGLGLLTGTISAIATEELNGMFELNMEYDSEGFLANEIKEEMIIKAKANDKQEEQLFRIYSITKNHDNDNLIIDAQHITNDLGNNFVEKIEARNLTKRQVMQLIGSSTNYDHPFNVTSSNTTTQSSTSLYRTNPLQMIAGMEGSVLQIWGGQIERDNFNLIMHDRRGSDDGVLVTYKKNLTGLTAKFDISNLVTRIFPFVFKEATDDEPEKLITVPGKYIDSPHINDYEMPYILPVDFANEFESDDEITPQRLNNVAKNWFVETGRDKPTVEMEVQFEHLWETEEYKDIAVLELVGMGDTITVKHSKLNVKGTAIVNRIEYDVIAEKNRAVDVGNVKASFTNKVNEVGKIIDRVEEIDKNANQAIRSVNGKNTIYYGPDEPTGNINVDDIWFRVVDGEYTRTYRYDGIQWQLVISKDVKDIEETANTAQNRASEAVEKAELATNNATEAISEAQTAFDKAQESLSTAEGLTSRMRGVEGDINIINQTTESYGRRIENTEGNISTLSNTAQGLQNRVADAEGNISSVTQIATGLQNRMIDAEGNINTLTETATSMQRIIQSKVSENLFVVDDLLLVFVAWSEIIDIPEEAGSLYFKAHGHVPKNVYLGYNLRDSNGEYVEYIRLDDVNRGKRIDIPPNIVQIAVSIETSGIEITREDIANMKIKIEVGDEPSAYTPAGEDTAFQTQITQLSDYINLRVLKGDVINQINIDTSGILISGKKLILDGDTTVTGTFRVNNANITSVDAGKITTGTLDAGRISVINLSANSIIGGILQSQNSNTTFNLNTGELNIVNNNITFGNGANINFLSNSNTLTYRKYDSSDGLTRSAGVGVGDRIGGRYPFAYLGATGASNLDSLSPYFSGFIANSTAATGSDNAANSVNGFIFQMRNRAVGWDKGITFDFNGNPNISMISGGSYDYTIGALKEIKGKQAFAIRNYSNDRSGWMIETTYSGDGRDITLGGMYGSDYDYQIGRNSSIHAIRNIYLRNNPIVVSDRRAKEDISSNTLGLDFINSIDTKLFRLKQKPSETDRNPLQFGFIAQDLIESLSSCGVDIKDHSMIGKGEDGLYNLKETQLIAPTIKAVQDLDNKVDLTREELVLKIAELEKELIETNRKIRKLEEAA